MQILANHRISLNSDAYESYDYEKDIAYVATREHIAYAVQLIAYKEAETSMLILNALSLAQDKGYFITDSVEAVLSGMPFDNPDDIVADKWFSVELVAGADSVIYHATALDVPPVIDTKIFAMQPYEHIETDPGKSDGSVCFENRLTYDHYMLRVLTGNYNKRYESGYYRYTRSRWNNIQNSELIYLHNSADSFDDFVSHVPEDKSYTAYSNSINVEAESEALRARCCPDGKISFTTLDDSKGYSDLEDIAFCNSISDELIANFNGKTILIPLSDLTALPLYESGKFIACICVDGIILVANYSLYRYSGYSRTSFDSSTFSVYFSAAGQTFDGGNFAFSDFAEYAYNPLSKYTADAPGWYTFSGGLFHKNENPADIWTMIGASNRIYENYSYIPIYLLNGITHEIPEVLNESDYAEIDNLFRRIPHTWEIGTVFSRVYNAHEKVFIEVYDTINRTALSFERERKMQNDVHSHNNFDILKQLNSTFFEKVQQAHTHDNKEYLDSIGNKYDYSKAAIINNNLYICELGKDSLNGIAVYNAEGTSPEVYKSMQTVGTPYPFWTIRDGANDSKIIFYDWALSDPFNVDTVNGILKTSKFLNGTYDSDYMSIEDIGADTLRNINTSGGDFYCTITLRQLLPLIERYAGQITNADGLFSNSTFITLPYLDFAVATNIDSLCESCSNLRCIKIDFDNATSAVGTFKECTSLEYINPESASAEDSCECNLYLPAIETMDEMLCGCNRIKNLCIDFGNHQVKTSNMDNAFYLMTALENLSFVNAKIKLDCDFSLVGQHEYINTKSSPQTVTTYDYSLTTDSVINFFNALEDNTGEETQYTVILPTPVFEQLTEEQKAIATAKNILVAGK